MGVLGIPPCKEWNANRKSRTFYFALDWITEIVLEVTAMSPRPGANRIEAHDPDTLAAARAVLDACADAREIGEAVKAAVARNASWRGEQCINLLAPEAPTSPSVRAL